MIGHRQVWRATGTNDKREAEEKTNGIAADIAAELERETLEARLLPSTRRSVTRSGARKQLDLVR